MVKEAISNLAIRKESSCAPSTAHPGVLRFSHLDVSRLSSVGPEIRRLVRPQVKPKTIFARSIDLLVREKVEVPGYFPLATLILRAINQHSREMVATIKHLLTPETQAFLDSLMVQEAADPTADPGKTSAYRLTAWKNFPSPPNPPLSRNAWPI